MAAHRKPRHRSAGGRRARTAATIALAGAATATAFDGTGHAEPELTPAQVKAKVDKLYQEAEVATEKYNGAREETEAAQRRLAALQDESARKAERLNEERDALGSVAAAQYRSGGLSPALRLALADDPDRYLEGAALAERAGSRQAATVTRVRKRLREIEQLRGAARVELASLTSRQAELKRHKKTITGKLATARRLLFRLAAEQRARLSADGTITATGTHRAERAGGPGDGLADPGARSPAPHWPCRIRRSYAPPRSGHS
ncbi:NlpC/P60 domain-containing protein OS=Streptomyces glaucescens OX=1907 GN=SGLAU_20605 PE=3 SV=1 [Streptomyces glaucescens]